MKTKIKTIKKRVTEGDDSRENGAVNNKRIRVNLNIMSLTSL